jgi:type III pantothenate kinase
MTPRAEKREGGRLTMILAVDVGNTQTVMGLFDGDRLAGHWRVSTNAALTADELVIKVNALLGVPGHDWSAVERVIVASVVPKLTDAWGDAARTATGRDPMVVGPGLRTGMAIKTDNPHEVGADRIANGVAALAVHDGPVLVVDFGTATTVDVIDASGAYIGGAIAPGVETVSASRTFTSS